MYFTAPKDSSNCVYRTCWKNTAQCHDNGQRKPRAPGSREKRFLWRMFSIMPKILEKLTKNTSIPSNVYLLNFQVVIHFVIMMIELHESSFSFHVIFLIHKESGLDTPQCGSKKKKKLNGDSTHVTHVQRASCSSIFLVIPSYDHLLTSTHNAQNAAPWCHCVHETN